MLKWKQGLGCGIGATVLTMALTPSVCAIEVGQIDDFEDGTLQGWTGANLLEPGTQTNQSTGGPSGVDDNFFRTPSTGTGGPGSRMVVIHESAPWVGDYLTAGVDSISFDVRSFEGSDLNLRFAVGSSGSWYVTNDANVQIITGGSDTWSNVSFDLDAASMTATTGVTASLEDVLGSVDTIRILSAVSFPSVGGGGPRGDSMAGVMDLDNITANPVPEPASLALLGLGGLALSMRRRRA